MATTYQVSPVSNDSEAAVYSNTGMTNKIGSISKGTTISVLSSGSNYYKISYKSSGGNSSSGTVKSNSGLNARNGPGSNYNRVGAFNNGASLTIHETSGSWYKVTGTSGWGTLSNVWVSKQYVVTSGSSNEAYISKTDVKSSSTSSASASPAYSGTMADEYDDSKIGTVHFTNYSYNPNSTNNAEYYSEMINLQQRCFGTPPKYSMDIDIQYGERSISRVMMSTFYSNPSVLSICPGKVKMFPGLFGTKKDTMVDTLIRSASGNDTLISKLKGDDGAAFTGKMYTFQADTAEFAKRVNVLCRACAVLLGIGDNFMPTTTQPLKSFDYAYWTIRKAYSPGVIKDKSIFNSFWNAGMDAVSGAVTDKNYLHFMLSNGGTSISEQMTTDTSENSIMQGIRSTVNGTTATLAYFLNSGFADQNTNLNDIIDSALSQSLGENGWTKLAKNLMSGGQMAFPKQIESVNWSQAAQCNLTFISPYGHPLSVFLWCIIPVMHILALALPKQVADNMYTFPHICRVCQKGWFNSNLAIISDVNITRGGSDDTSWTSEGLSTEWNVTFSVVPLLEQLMVTSSDNPFLFIKNEGLIDYLGNMCSFDLKANNLNTKLELFTGFVVSKYTTIPNDLQRHISDSLSGLISDIVQF